MKIKDQDIVITPNNPSKGWKRGMSFFSWKDGELMIPAIGIGISDAAAVLRAGFDGVSIVCQQGTVLIPESWARKEKPDMIGVLLFSSLL